MPDYRDRVPVGRRAPLAARTSAVLVVLLLAALVPAPADAGKRKPSGIKGVILSSTCYGPCIEPPPPEQPYTGEVTVTVNRVADGKLVASAKPSDGKFGFRLKRGFYDVTATPPAPVPTPCPPGYVCPAESPAVVVMPCETGETKRVRVKRRRVTRVELHVRNVCIQWRAQRAICAP